MKDSDGNALTPLSYLKIFFRRKEILFSCMFVGLVLGICAGIILPKEYMSSTVIMVEEGKSDNPLFDQLAVSTTVKQRMSAIRESMLGWTSLVKLVKRLNMDVGINTPKEFEDLIQDIRDKIVIKLRGRNIIDLSYYGEDPELTQAVVQNVTDIFIERNVEIQNKETSDAIIFIEQQLKVYRGKIKSAEIARLKDQLETLLIDSTEAHPQVKQLREQIKAKEEQLQKENLEYTTDIVLDTDTNNPLIKEIQTALVSLESGPDNMATATAMAQQTPGGASNDVKDEFYKVMLLEKMNKVMARDVKVNTSIYNMLLQRLETAKITQRLQSSKEGTKYTILDPPRIPLDPEKPNLLFLALGCLIAGALVGVGIVFSLEFLDKSFIDVEEAKQYLGVPLLGAISKINTEASVRAERERLGWVYSLTVIGGLVVIILTKAITNFLN